MSKFKDLEDEFNEFKAYTCNRLRILECSHESIEFKRTYDIHRYYSTYAKVCNSCGLVLERHITEEDYIKAEIINLSERITKLKESLPKGGKKNA